MYNENWHSLIDTLVRQAIGDGRIEDHVPGAGQPLDLDTDPYTPPEMRNAFKIMRDNDAAPDWIVQGNLLDDERAHILDGLHGAVRTYRGMLGDVGRVSPDQAPAYRDNAEGVWSAARGRLAQEAARHNKQVLTYNLKVPPGVTHKRPLDFERELQRLLTG